MVIVINRGSHSYKIKPHKTTDPAYPYSYNLYCNGEWITTGGGARYKEMARGEAMADIEQHEQDLKMEIA